MWRAIYNLLFIPVLWIVIHALGLFYPKVKRGLLGRRHLMSDLKTFLDDAPASRRLWIHASSMGEFEQAKPIIEGIKESVPDLLVIATFFSPSGYENNLRYPHADYISYIPFDSKKNAEEFLSQLKPDVAAFIRYDIWPNHLWECQQRRIPVILTNATMRKNSMRRLPGIRSFHRCVFDAIDLILTVSEEDARRFDLYSLRHAAVMPIGDTRYDRVEGKATTARKNRLLPDSIAGGKKIVVAGSSWQEDEDVFLPVFFKLLRYDDSLLFIIVPHEPTIERLEILEHKMKRHVRSIRFSHLSQYRNETVILVDSIGILLSLYASAHVAFVGGGFKSNVHNTLEPAVYGIPVLYGPRIQNSQEALQLCETGGSFIVSDKREMYRILRSLLSDDRRREEVGSLAGNFVHSRSGATKKIIEHLLKYFPENQFGQ